MGTTKKTSSMMIEIEAEVAKIIAKTRPERRRTDALPKGWPKLRDRVLKRAGGRCEGSPQHPDCKAEGPLMIANPGRRLADCTAEDLRAWCRDCATDFVIAREMRAAGIAKHRREKKHGSAPETMALFAV